MTGAFWGYAYGMLLFALAGEATTPWLRWAGVAGAVLMVVSGSFAGWQAARRV